MVKVTRQNPQVFQQLAARFKQLDGLQVRAGWFESTKYEDGTPVAGIAAVQEFGATINHPGGTAYKIGPDGKAIFVANSAPGAAALPKTKPHTIVIPPRPFMRPTSAREHDNWIKLIGQGAKMVITKGYSAFNVMDAFGARAAGDIAKSIAEVTTPALKAGTIAARRRALTDKKTVGALDKPLVASGIMIDTVTHIVEKEP